ncbi:MAG: serine/threonine-protein kinase [Bdellovibrionales bacterium]
MDPTIDDVNTPAFLGRYRILGRYGAGGMGTVFRDQDPDLDRIVAIKIPHFEGPPEVRSARMQRFQREARLAARVHHPNVCQIFDVGERDGQPFVGMGFVEGQSLAQWLKENRRFKDIEKAVKLVLPLVEALQAIHGLGIIHRDIKPGNILFNDQGKLVLTDFGLARPEVGEDEFTSEGMILGTPGYMAPEQASGNSATLGPRTDLYSMGLVLYEMLTGRLPLEGPTPLRLQRMIVEDPPSPRIIDRGSIPTWRPSCCLPCGKIQRKDFRRPPRLLPNSASGNCPRTRLNRHPRPLPPKPRK